MTKEQITMIDLRRRTSARTIRALGLLLAFALLTACAFPTSADDLEPPPPIPHYFTGRVSTFAGPVPEGTLVEAFVEGAKKAETTVKAEGRYELDVPGGVGDEGKTVTFKVAGIQAYETTTWESGKLDFDFNLTISALPDGSSPPFPFPFPFECFIATAAYGSPTAKQISALRDFRDAVLLENSSGRLFVALYYRLSPAIANIIARSDLLRAIVRELLLDPLVLMVQATRHMWGN